MKKSPSSSAEQPIPVKLKVIWKDRKHDHFWTDGGSLCESYKTIRGLRWKWKAYIGEELDRDQITDGELEQLGFTVKSLSDL